jgi:hypothetical protein
MKKFILMIITVILISLLAIISLFLIQPFLTGKAIQEEPPEIYTYTKAICNESNYCQDHIIKCQGNKTIEISPITGAAVQFNPDKFKDPRDKRIIEKTC